MVQKAPLPIFQAGMDGLCLFVNQKWEAETGLEKDRSLGKGWRSCIAEKDAEAMLELVKATAHSEADNLEIFLSITHASGEHAQCPVHIIIDRDEAGRALFFTGFVQPAVGAKTRDLHALISSLEDIILEIDYQKVFRNVWTRDDAALFLPRDQFLNKTVDEVFGEQAPVFTDVIDEVIRTGKPRELIYPGLFQFSQKWFRAKVRPLSSEALAGQPSLVVIIQEYTETRTYWEALEVARRDLEQGKRLLDISEQLSLSSGWELDLATQNITMTEQAYQIYELEAKTPMTFEILHRFYDPADWEKLLEAQTIAVARQSNFDVEFEITTPNGKKKWVRLIGVPVVKEHVVVAIAGAMMDISEKKAIEKELIEAKTLAETAAQEKMDFLSIMSHEIRTPLNNIIGLANLLKLEHLPENEEYVDNLVFSSNHLLQLINDILSLQKIEEGAFDSHLISTNLTELVENIKNQFMHFANEKKIVLKSVSDSRIPEVMANPTLLAQVLNNLISNAIKFTEEGSVTIRLSLQENDGTSVLIRFSVSDTGIGIPEAKQEEIFERFKQLRNPAMDKYPGTGLGLTITKKLIESQGSRILLHSIPGKGTEFYFGLHFQLPHHGYRDAPTAAPAASMQDYKGKLSHLNLLLVEDNPVNVIITKNQLKYFGISPDCATHGEEALKMLENRFYHLLLLDLHIPEPDGYFLAAILRERYPGTQVIVFTADNFSVEEPRLEALGLKHILKKPFLPEELLAMLLKTSQDA